METAPVDGVVALFPSAPAELSPVAVLEVPDGYVAVELVHPSTDNVRGELGDLDGLTESIREIGVLQALLLQPHPDRPGEFRIVAGHRRYQAAVDAGLGWVPFMLTDKLDLTPDRVAAMVAENTLREGLSPLEEARALATMRDGGLSQRRIAAAIGRTQAHVSRRLALLGLEEPFQVLLDTGGITVENAVRVTQVTPMVRALLLDTVLAASDDEMRSIGSDDIEAAVELDASRQNQLWWRRRVEDRGVKILDGAEWSWSHEGARGNMLRCEDRNVEPAEGYLTHDRLTAAWFSPLTKTSTAYVVFYIAQPERSAAPATSPAAPQTPPLTPGPKPMAAPREKDPRQDRLEAFLFDVPRSGSAAHDAALVLAVFGQAVADGCIHLFGLPGYGAPSRVDRCGDPVTAGLVSVLELCRDCWLQAPSEFDVDAAEWDDPFTPAVCEPFAVWLHEAGYSFSWGELEFARGHGWLSLEQPALFDLDVPAGPAVTVPVPELVSVEPVWRPHFELADEAWFEQILPFMSSLDELAAMRAGVVEHGHAQRDWVLAEIDARIAQLGGVS